MARKIFPQFTVIKDHRTNRGWSQDWTAQAAGISTRTYQRIEGGDGCSFETLKSLAAAFDVDFKTLLPSPETDTTGACDTSFTPSWLRLIKAFAWRVVFMPIFVAFLFLSAFASLLGVSYLAHKADIVHISAFVPMTDEERPLREAEIAQILKEHPDHPLYSMKHVPRKEPWSEKEGYRVIMMFLFSLPWMLCFGWKFSEFLYNRDYQMLVIRPTELWLTRFGRTLKAWILMGLPAQWQ